MQDLTEDDQGAERDNTVLGRYRTATVLGRQRTAPVLGRERPPVDTASTTPSPTVDAPPAARVAETPHETRTDRPSLSDTPSGGAMGFDNPESPEARVQAREALRQVNDPDVARFMRENPDADINDWQRWTDAGRLQGRRLKPTERRAMQRDMQRMGGR